MHTQEIVSFCRLSKGGKETPVKNLYVILLLLKASQAFLQNVRQSLALGNLFCNTLIREDVC